jgi:aryl-alcohol dehydrogenase-like predicted oxidoreductase
LTGSTCVPGYAPGTDRAEQEHPAEGRLGEFAVARKTLGRTGLQVSTLALGTAELGLEYGISVPGSSSRPTREDAVSLVREAVDLGVNLFDTATAYGESEGILGEALTGRWSGVHVATKTLVHAADGAMLPPGELARHMTTSLNGSLRALRRDHVDIWFVHNVDSQVLARLEEVKQALCEARASGKVRWAGATAYGVEVPEACLRTETFDVLQVAYSVLDQRIADQVLPLAAQQEVGIIARSVLLKGVLTERADHLPWRLAELCKRSLSFRRMVSESGLGLGPAQAAIAFAIANPSIHSTLVGVSTKNELREDMRAAGVQLPAEFLSQLRTLRLDDVELLNPSTWRLP